MMKKFLAGVLILALAFGTTACGNGGSGDGIVSSVSKMLSSQGRSYDKLITGKTGELLTTSFFEFTVNNVEGADSIDGMKPQVEGNKFIIAEVTVKNIFKNEKGGGEKIPVGNYDFTIVWDSEEEIPEEDTYGYQALDDTMYPDNVTLDYEKTLSGKLIFEIPVDVNDFLITYNEIYEDSFKGDTYAIECSL